MPNRPIRLAAPLAGLILSFAALALSPAWAGQAALAAGAADTQAREIVRLINGERSYLGKRTLATDTYLMSKARDGAIACPNNTSLVMAGRAKDIAVYGYFYHNLRLCTQYTSIDVMATWGYKTGRGEILASNRGYGTGTVSYRYGCKPGVTSCPGPTTSTYSTTAHAMAGWIQSSGHYSIIVGNYDRVGCGAWVGSDGTYIYSCLFSLGARSGGSGGGGSGATPRPVSRPASPALEADTPSPSAVAESLSPWATPSGASGLLYALPVSSAGNAGPVDGSDPGGSRDPASSVPVLAGASVAAGAAAAFSVALVAWPRRRRRSPPRG